MGNILKSFRLNDNFLGKYETLAVEQVIPYQEKALRDEIPDADKSHAIENFRLAAKKLAEGHCDEEFYGMVFQDSDVAKGEIITEDYRPELLSGIRALKVPGIRTKRMEELYSSKKPEQEKVTITAIPYYAWGNRGLNEMRVWLPEA